MVSQLLIVRVLALIAFGGVALIVFGPIQSLSGWTIGILSGICGGIIALWIRAEWQNSQEDDNES